MHGSEHAAAPIDFGRSVPPLVPELGAALAVTLREIAAVHDGGIILRRAGAGTERDRTAGASWLAERLGSRVAPDRVVIANGTQTLLRLLFEALARPATVLAEALSYGVIKEVARLSRVHLVAVAVDDEGLIPQALDEMAERSGARLLYCNPTAQNPTTAVMPASRRSHIGEIARRRGLTIIEDDVLGPLQPDAAAPIAATHPDVTWYLQSTAKALAHGMRVAYAVGPSTAAVLEVTTFVHGLSFWVPAPLALEVVTRFVEAGHAAQVCAAIRREAAAREALARRLLGRFGVATKPGSLHAWLPTGPVSGSEFTRAAAAGGILVRAGRDFAVSDDAPDIPYIRLSLSSPLTAAQVERGLMQLADQLGSSKHAAPKEILRR